VPDSEARYFVFRGKAYAREGDAPALVHEVARRIDSPFFSVDVALDANGELRLIELGDGQVSDRKHWPAARLIEMLCA
jgi:ATP-grasp domain, R2K clade family 3